MESNSVKKKKIKAFLLDKSFEILISILMLALIGIYCYFIREIKDLEVRVWNVEQKATVIDKNTEAVSKEVQVAKEELEIRLKNLEDRTDLILNRLEKQVEKLDLLVMTLIKNGKRQNQGG